MKIQWKSLWSILVIILLLPIIAIIAIRSKDMRQLTLEILTFLLPGVSTVVVLWSLLNSPKERMLRKKILELFPGNLFSFSKIKTIGSISKKTYYINLNGVVVRGVGFLCVHPNECTPMEHLLILAMYARYEEQYLLKNAAYHPAIISREGRYRDLCQEVKTHPIFNKEYTH
jgi:hypothetical protein